MRLDYRRLGADAYRAFGLVHRYAASRLDCQLLQLIYLRISQLNGCAYCIDLHWKEASTAGVDPRKLNLLAVWQESALFLPRERAALAWAEALSLICVRSPQDAVYDEALAQFGEQGVVDLSFAIALMNAFNRLGVGFRQEPDPANEVEHANSG
jgi:AhpD family alkylhydroperoxidase